jgi:single-stranded-DNA-specific exonuclease
LPDPHIVTDMQAASARIVDAVLGGENTAIFGDYDVDGATAAALLCRYLRLCSLDPIVHIPDRILKATGRTWTRSVRSLSVV